MKKLSILFLCSVLFSLTSCQDNYPDLEDGLYAEFVTNQGTFVAELFHEATPITVASFVSLAEGSSDMVSEQYQGQNFYDGLVFHRVIEGFMIQGGDPTGTGTSGPGYEFPNEIVDSLQHDSKGILSMANSGPNTNGSQFFITLAETPWLNGMHTVFGEVVSGMEVVETIGSIETDATDRPVNEVVIEKVNIIRKGSSAKNFDAPKVLPQELENLEAAAREREENLTQQRNELAQRFDNLEEEAEELESGLKIYFETEGDGEQPTTGQQVTVYYEGYLRDGQLFDTNRENVANDWDQFNPRRKSQGGYEPMPMEYSPNAPMIPGFKEGVQQMKVGDKAFLFIPSHLGYGQAGAGGVIPPNSDLVFVVELVEIQ